MLVLTKSCQNTEYRYTASVAYGAADLSVCLFSTTESTTARELHNWRMASEMWWLGQVCVCVCCLPGEHLAAECTGRWQISRGRLMLWAMVCCQILGPVVRLDAILTCSTYSRSALLQTIYTLSCTIFVTLLTKATDLHPS